MAGAAIDREPAAPDIGHSFIGAFAIFGARDFPPLFEFAGLRYLCTDNLCHVCRVLR